MPRFRPKGVLERTAVDDLWKHTLSRIPTIYGRLAYLASLRDSNSGIYRHHGLSTAFGRDESVRALKQSHENVFLEWLNLSVAEKFEDLNRYLAGLDDTAAGVIEHWLQSGAYKMQVPGTARGTETQLYCTELEAMLAVMRNGLAANGPGPDSSPPA